MIAPRAGAPPAGPKCPPAAPAYTPAASSRAAWALLAGTLLLAGCLEQREQADATKVHGAVASTAQGAVAIFAGGCFWCVEADFEKLDGVLAAESGYIGGHVDNPSYQLVGYGNTGHAEAVRVIYDPQKLNYGRLVDHFWRNIDPTVKDRQFCDVGDAYRSGIYWQTEDERLVAEGTRAALIGSSRFPAVFTEVERATTFWMAEEYHQDYAKKNPEKYALYRYKCGRDARLKALWGAP